MTDETESIDSNSLMFSDKNGKLRAVVAESGLMFCDKNGKLRAKMSMDSDGAPSLELLDEHGTDRAVLGSTTTEVIATGESRKRAESSLILFNKDSKVIWTAP